MHHRPPLCSVPTESDPGSLRGRRDAIHHGGDARRYLLRRRIAETHREVGLPDEEHVHPRRGNGREDVFAQVALDLRDEHRLARDTRPKLGNRAATVLTVALTGDMPRSPSGAKRALRTSASASPSLATSAS